MVHTLVVRIRDLLLRRQKELPLLLGLMALAAGSCVYGATRLPVVLLTDPALVDLWFGADLFRFFGNMLSPDFLHGYSDRHPLSSLLTYLPAQALRLAPGLSGLTALYVILAVCAAAWSGTLYVLMRCLGCGRPESALFTLLGIVSAGSVFFFVVPETFPPGAVTLGLALSVVALAQRRNVPDKVLVLASALTLSFSTTNWMVGLLAAFALRPWRRAVLISAQALALVFVLWLVQGVMLRGDRPFWLGTALSGSVVTPDARSLAAHAASFFFHTVVAPAHRFHPSFAGDEGFLELSFHHPFPGSVGMPGVVAAVAWAALLALGVYGWSRKDGPRPLRIVLAGSLVGQFALHAVFGRETFLYSPHFLPLLLVLAAYGLPTPARPLVLGLTVLLVPCAAWNNLEAFNSARSYIAGLPVSESSDTSRLGARLRRAQLGGADLRRANLFASDLRDAQLQGADLREAILTGARLRNADLQDADLRAAVLDYAKLRGANFSGADLRSTRFEWADLDSVNVRGARYDAETRWPTGFVPGSSGAVLVPPPAREPASGAGSPQAPEEKHQGVGKRRSDDTTP